jgi:hypothetical protein
MKPSGPPPKLPSFKAIAVAILVIGALIAIWGVPGTPTNTGLQDDVLVDVSEKFDPSLPDERRPLAPTPTPTPTPMPASGDGSRDR